METGARNEKLSGIGDVNGSPPEVPCPSLRHSSSTMESSIRRVRRSWTRAVFGHVVHGEHLGSIITLLWDETKVTEAAKKKRKRDDHIRLLFWLVASILSEKHSS